MKIRTSQTDPLRIAEVSCAPFASGMIGVTFCPGKSGDSLFGSGWARDLRLDVGAIAQWGARAVLTLVEDKELKLLKVEQLGDEVQRHGMTWLHLPIVDVRPPSAAFHTGWQDARQDVLQWLADGERVLVHCRGGLGRAGTIAACLLIELGCDAATAIGRVREVRPGAIETREQEHYVMGYPAIAAATGAIP